MKRISFFFLVFFPSSWIILAAQWEFGEPGYEDTLEVYEDLFSQDKPLDLTLKFNIRAFRRTRAEEKYHAAEMTNQYSDSLRLSHAVRVKARGTYRRDNCNMPPFWLNIRYSGIGNEELEGVRRMKVVTRCRDNRVYSDYVLREYLVYKIYNLLTPYSFRVRLVNLKYVDTGRDNRESQDWAFLIEPEEMLAERLHGRMVKSDELSMKIVNPEVMDRLAMFQYMIGNGDYSVTGRHNLKIVLTESGPGGYIPVPYDFDYTGFVNTSYAVPAEGLGINSVRERYYLGPCRKPGYYHRVIRDLELVREEIEAMIWSFDYLDEESRFDLIGYIESFFNTAANERFIERSIMSTCR